jgi:hypothetical protein
VPRTTPRSLTTGFYEAEKAFRRATKNGSVFQEVDHDIGIEQDVAPFSERGEETFYSHAARSSRT